jgi:hypothetical protein
LRQPFPFCELRSFLKRISFTFFNRTVLLLLHHRLGSALILYCGGRSPAANGVGTGEFWVFWAKTLQKAAEMDGKVGLSPGHFRELAARHSSTAAGDD